MTDLTVLVSPTPLIPSTRGLFSKRPAFSSTPIMVTLDSSAVTSSSSSSSSPPPLDHSSWVSSPTDPSSSSSPSTSRGTSDETRHRQQQQQLHPLQTQGDAMGPYSRRSSRRHRQDPNYDASLLSPPVNTWKAPRHRPTRSRSAPPGRESNPSYTVSYQRRGEGAGDGDGGRGTTTTVFDTVDTGRLQRSQELPEDFAYRFAIPSPISPLTPKQRRFGGAGGAMAVVRAGELVRPAPPLFRPTTFWRKTRKSGVSSPSYSPSTHLIRRSTYIAAGLAFDAPVHDLSALCVESRVGFLVVPCAGELL